MTRIKILTATEQKLPLVLNGRSATIPNDGAFHELDAAFLPLLDDAHVAYEIENVEARGAAASTGGADGLGRASAPLPPKRPSLTKRLKDSLTPAKKRTRK